MPAFFFGSQMISITELGAKTGHSHIKKQSFKMSPTSEMGHSRRFRRVRGMSGDGIISEMLAVRFCRSASAGAIHRNKLANPARRANQSVLVNFPVQSPLQKYLASRVGQITSTTLAVLSRKRGVAQRHQRGMGMRWTRKALVTKAPDADGKGVWS